MQIWPPCCAAVSVKHASSDALMHLIVWKTNTVCGWTSASKLSPVESHDYIPRALSDLHWHGDLILHLGCLGISFEGKLGFALQTWLSAKHLRDTKRDNDNNGINTNKC